MGILVALVLAFAPGELDYPTELFSPATDFETRIQQLSESIARTPVEPGNEEELSHLYSLRGINRLLAGHPEEEAFDDLNTALEFDPDNSEARMWRAECYDRMGNSIAAQADRMQIPGLEQSIPLSSFFSYGSSCSIRPITAWMIAAAVWGGLVAAYIVVGWPQKEITEGALSPLLVAAFLLATLGTFPVATLAMLTSRGELPSVWWITVTIATTLSAVISSAFLKPPFSFPGTKTKLPRVLDERFLNQVRVLAARMKVSVPLVRLWHTIDGSQRVQAAAGTIHAPQLIVTDGVLQRLEPAECDAIVAHELAHIANKSMWLLCAPIPLGCAAGVAMLPLMPVPSAVAFGFAFFVGLKRVLSQPIELDCDLRAARAIGFRAAIAALTKLHAVHPLENSGLVSILVHATSTHPSRDVRLASLYDAAPAEDRPEMPPDRAGLVQHRVATVSALFLWTVSIAGTLALSLKGYYAVWMGVLLWAVASAPYVLLLIATWKQTSVIQLRMGRRHWYLRPALILGGCIVAMVVLKTETVRRVLRETHQEGPYAGLAVIASMIVTAGGLSIWLMRTSRARKLHRDVLVAFQVHDFRGVKKLCLDAPNLVRRSDLLRYQQALAQAFCGDVPGAIEALEVLWKDKPAFPLTGFALCSFLLDSGRSERVIEVARRLSELLPGDPQPAFFEALALRRLNRAEEAEAACLRALKLDAESGPICALAASLALDQGNLERANELCSSARERSPGDLHLRIAEAEIALHGDSLEAARSIVDRAIDAIRANPMSPLDFEARRLEALLKDRESPILTDDVFLE